MYGLKKTKRFNVRFKGRDFILLGSKKRGALITKEQMDGWKTGDYYLNEDGKIRSEGTKVVGTIKDIEFV